MAGSYEEGIVAPLGSGPALIVLDNLEQLLPGAAAPLGALLAIISTLHVIATSREPLHLAAEHQLPLEALSDREAAALLVQRATTSDPSFDPDSDQETISAICATVDRLPLAIELAAARTRLLSTEAAAR